MLVRLEQVVVKARVARLLPENQRVEGEQLLQPAAWPEMSDKDNRNTHTSIRRVGVDLIPCLELSPCPSRWTNIR